MCLLSEVVEVVLVVGWMTERWWWFCGGGKGNVHKVDDWLDGSVEKANKETRRGREELS